MQPVPLGCHATKPSALLALLGNPCASFSCSALARVPSQIPVGLLPLPRAPQAHSAPPPTPAQTHPCIVTVCLLARLPQRQQITRRQRLCLVQRCEPGVCVVGADAQVWLAWTVNDGRAGGGHPSWPGVPAPGGDRQPGAGADGGRLFASLFLTWSHTSRNRASPCDLCLLPCEPVAKARAAGSGEENRGTAIECPLDARLGACHREQSGPVGGVGSGESGDRNPGSSFTLCDLGQVPSPWEMGVMIISSECTS